MSAPRHEGENELRLADDEKPNAARLSLGESDSDIVFDHEKTDRPVKKSTTRSTGYSGDSEHSGPAPESGLERERKWYTKLNPLRWGPIPPVPEERSVSHELGASILSIITFQWMSPLMKVSTRRLLLQTVSTKPQ